MVKKQNKNNSKGQEMQGKAACSGKASKIGHSTPYDYCSERLSPFGGFLGLVKFIVLPCKNFFFLQVFTTPLPPFLRGI